MKLLNKKIKSLKTGALCILVALMGIMVIILTPTAHGQNNIVDIKRMYPPATSGDNVEVIEGIYYDYLSVECANGRAYLLNEDGNWFNRNGSVKYESGEVLTAVIVDGKIVVLLRE